MSNKKNDVERKPDLNEAANQAEIEARIKEMMEPEETKPLNEPITTTSGEAKTPITAPELPLAKKPLAIKVVDRSDSSQVVEPEGSNNIEKPATDSELAVAIAEANKQLLDNTGTASETSLVIPEPAEKIAEPEEVSEIPEKKNKTDEVLTDEIDPEEHETPNAVDEPEGESKEKPLKHLDSIIPKTKLEETLEDGKTADAVEDIIAKESDALLVAEDEKLAAAFRPEPRPSFTQKLKTFFGKKPVRLTIMVLLLLAVATAGVVPDTRYFAMNVAGVRSSSSIVVLDESSQQPLKGVTVSLAGQTETTDQDGRATFSKLKLGKTELVVEKRAFAATNKQLTLGWGSNPLADVLLAPTGSQYVLALTDFLTTKPVGKVEATSNEATAISNEKGELRLTIDTQDESEREVIITAAGYREERFTLNLDQKETISLQLVAARKHAFISKRSGRYDVYKVDIDGKNEKLVLPGTGSERDDTVLVSHPADEVAALVSTKDNKRNKDGFLLSTLTVMNLGEETSKSVATSERVQIIDWVGSRVVYVQVKDGASGNSPDRHKLVSYDYKTGESKELASSNYFNDVMVASGKVYFAPSSTYIGAAGAGFFRIEADGNNKQTILSQEVWNVFRTNYDRLTLAVQQEWYELRVGEIKAGKISGEPPAQTSRVYIDSPDEKHSLWVDNRDGKGVLLAYNTETKEDANIRTQGGLKQPVRWLSNSVVVYRVSTEAETADYVLNLDGGEPKKIRDVTNTSGVNTWYFY